MNASEYNERLKTTGRNDPCPCGSGRKYKKCHLGEDEGARHADLVKAAEDREAALSSEGAQGAENADDSGDAEGRAEGKSSQSKGRRERHQQPGRASSGRGRPANIPRRGAV